jgi:hypothetical protein
VQAQASVGSEVAKLVLEAGVGLHFSPASLLNLCHRTIASKPEHHVSETSLHLAKMDNQ